MAVLLEFRQFLLEMETTMDEKAKIREIIQHLIDGDKQWISDHWILASNKSGYWVLNYIQGPRNEYNRLVRGMVVQQPPPGWSGDPLTLIKSFPFIRFFNQGEKEGVSINFSNAEMLEKMDGTMVGVFFPHGDVTDPHWHTRKMVSADAQDMGRKITTFGGKEFKFMPIIGEYVRKLKFSPEDAAYTYVFEFVHEASYVMTKYKPEQFGLYLLGARHLPDHKELTEQELDVVAARIGAFRPRRWDAMASHEEIERMMKELAAETADFEGFVFRDRETGARLKVKDADYVRKHHMIDDARSIKTLLPIILQGEEDEVIAYHPHAKERVEEIKEAYEKYLTKVVSKIKEWQAKGLKGQQLAHTLFGMNPLQKWEIKAMKLRGESPPKANPAEPDEYIRGKIMDFVNRKSDITDENDIRAMIDADLKSIALGDGHQAGSPRRLMDIIGLVDKEEEEAADVGEI
jgi:hypothetical protein